jgi:hypothetical protein
MTREANLPGKRQRVSRQSPGPVVRHHTALPLTFNSRRAHQPQIVPIARLAVERGREDAHVKLCPEEVVFALRNAVTNDASFPLRTFRRRRDAAIIAERKRPDLHD